MTRKHWPIIAGGIGIAGAAAIVSVLVLGGGEDEEAKARAIAASKVAELEREHQRLIAEAKIEQARAAAIAAAEQARVAAEEEQREREAQAARARALEEARTKGILGSAALTQGGAFASLTGTGDISSGFDDTNLYGGLLGNEVGEMSGGLGFRGDSGTGIGGGGAGGQGTIGLGSYGTLGHGSGTGQGYGVGRGGMRGKPAAAPTVRTSVTEVSGDLDKAIVLRHLRRYLARVSYCYQKQLAIEPGLAGTVTARFDVDAQGQVTSSTASGLNDEVASCVAATLRRSTFPRPTSGTVSVTASFTMSPPAPATP